MVAQCVTKLSAFCLVPNFVSCFKERRVLDTPIHQMNSLNTVTTHLFQICINTSFLKWPFMPCALTKVRYTRIFLVFPRMPINNDNDDNTDNI
jgi:hypothetical protein